VPRFVRDGSVGAVLLFAQWGSYDVLLRISAAYAAPSVPQLVRGSKSTQAFARAPALCVMVVLGRCFFLHSGAPMMCSYVHWQRKSLEAKVTFVSPTFHGLLVLYLHALFRTLHTNYPKFISKGVRVVEVGQVEGLIWLN
jgi:hypothetical protein